MAPIHPPPSSRHLWSFIGRSQVAILLLKTPFLVKDHNVDNEHVSEMLVNWRPGRHLGESEGRFVGKGEECDVGPMLQGGSPVRAD